MKYIINLSLVFDIDTRTLTLKNDDHLFIELSKPATRLLCELIVNNNITLIREDIIRTVWIDYGFTPSTASLSNHISELRKAFENLGLNKEIIVTVPRTGFRMEADIHPVVISEDNTKETVTEPQCDVTKGVLIAEMNKSVTVKSGILTGIAQRKIELKKGIFTVGIIITSVAAVIALITLPKNKKPQVIFTKEQCSIYNVSNKPPAADFIANATQMMSAEGIDCKHKTVDVYYTEPRPGNKLSINFMAVCYAGENSSYQSCINYKNIK